MMVTTPRKRSDHRSYRAGEGQVIPGLRDDHMRCIAHQMPCAVVQFIKGTWQTGERQLLEENSPTNAGFSYYGEEVYMETQDRDRDIAAARHGWEMPKR